MARERSDTKTFNPREVKEILERASVHAAERSDALTFAELAEVAEGAGIDRQALEHAVALQGRAALAPAAPLPPGPLDLFFGAPRRITRLERLPGPVEGEALERLREALDQGLARRGHAWISGNTWTWSAGSVVGPARVSVTNGRDGATLRLDAGFYGPAGALFGGVFMGGGNAVGWPLFGVLLYMRSPLYALAALAGSMLLAYGLARWLFRGVVVRREHQLDAILRAQLAELDAAARSPE